MGPVLKFMCFALLALFFAGAAQAEWAKQVYSAEYESCLPPCDRNSPKEHDKCVNYCTCVTDNMQAQFADHDQLTRQAFAEKRRERIATLQRIVNSCNHKSWGTPARKLLVR